MRTNPVFSPSQTKDFLRDPAAWYMVHVAKWVPRYIAKKGVSGIAGIAFADGVAVYNNGLRDGEQARTSEGPLAKASAKVASDRAKAEKVKALELGQIVYEDQADTWNNLETLVAKSIFKYADHSAATLPPYPIKDVEVDLGEEFGWARLDLVLDSPFGPVVVDYKHKFTLDARYEPKTLNEYRYDWQMLHYAWAYGASTSTRVRQTAIVLFVAEPRVRAPKYDPVVVEPELLKWWEKSARTVWATMEAIREGKPLHIEAPFPWMTFKWYAQFGKEDWAGMFLEHKLNPSTMTRDYIQRKESNANAFQS